MKTIKLCIAIAFIAITGNINAQSIQKVTLDSYLTFSSEIAKELGYSSIYTKDTKSANLEISKDGSSTLTLPLNLTKSSTSKSTRGPGDGGICIQIYIATRKSNCKSGIGFRCQTITSCGGNQKKSNELINSRYVTATASIKSNNLVLKFDQNLSKFE